MTEPQRTVRVSSHVREGRQVRGYTRNQDAAKEQWNTRKWQAAAGGMFVLIILGELLVGVSEIAIALTVVILLGLNYLIKTLTTPRQKPQRRRQVRMRRHVVRKRGPRR